MLGRLDIEVRCQKIEEGCSFDIAIEGFSLSTDQQKRSEKERQDLVHYGELCQRLVDCGAPLPHIVQVLKKQSLKLVIRIDLSLSI